MKAKQSLLRRWKKRSSNYLTRAVGPGLFRMLAWSWKIRYVNRAEVEARGSKEFGPVISFWHQHIPAGIGAHIGYPARVVVSLHRDGEMISHIATRLGYKTVRGSTSKGGSKVVREILDGSFGLDALCFTPDGPRGPCYSVAPGVAFIAAQTRRKVVLTGFAASNYWQAKSWDRMIIPKPFSKVVVTYSDDLGVPSEEVSNAGPEQEQFRKDLRAGMDECEARAKQEIQDWLAE
ncbi:MAG: lysophospholipid acyltransferase family protein [Planctomycetes bacterium]|nr:lysophospholipid acyltransferase family protein [Planctomycetota bacterium]MCP4771120.1 lysophospholipid acyltransferase family protein [Planctomycetota bacterium]MCP4860827.1 lysophospholipid acyltransferase family protein [Planctomycetota bacterium]